MNWATNWTDSLFFWFVVHFMPISTADWLNKHIALMNHRQFSHCLTTLHWKKAGEKRLRKKGMSLLKPLRQKGNNQLLQNWSTYTPVQKSPFLPSKDLIRGLYVNYNIPSWPCIKTCSRGVPKPPEKLLGCIGGWHGEKRWPSPFLSDQNCCVCGLPPLNVSCCLYKGIDTEVLLQYIEMELNT